MRRSTVNILLILATIAIFIVALAIGLDKGEFGGTDASATDEIAKVDADYEAWFEPIWTQPGGEVESGLFALQAAVGAGILGFVLGTYRERRKHVDDATGAAEPDPSGTPVT